jgi:hypothetical protein
VNTSNKWVDYLSWSGDLDVVANDHYVRADDPERHVELAFSADLTRGVAGRTAVDPHGALDLRRQLAAAQQDQGTRRDAAQRAVPRREGRRRGDALPVAPVRRGRGEVALGDGAARGTGHARLA